ncbi:ABC transporter permease [Arthrobacter sp. FW306-2-2C-D06B]|uniref:ABC transporter permease n=1 Tax=Arthrobacter sp. FW306-2-2C-D06B TaxID=2879618 RepID=UPI001F009FED|nr:ABC transporter permease subunit [Arthrobacter sp. FW306-2-2C-D06B]UKA57231.1 ABC transporter permease subunit [Arthrobacter sp. FW306-2-2C-D06B]
MTGEYVLGRPRPAPDWAAHLLRNTRFFLSPAALFWVVIMAILVAPIAVFLAVGVIPGTFGLDAGALDFSAFSVLTQGKMLSAMVNSLVLGVVVAVAATAIAGTVAWLVHRTDVPLRGLSAAAMFAVLITPSYLMAMGWQRLLEPGGVLEVAGIDASGARAILYGPVGVAMVLTFKGIPFAYLAISAALRGLGQEFEHAVRVHGGSARDAAKIVLALISPAMASALAIVFAEAISDFGVATTLGRAGGFTVATYGIYDAIQAFPVQFQAASAVSWVLLLLIVIALVLQSAALRGRSYRVLGGRTRPAARKRLGPAGKALGGTFLTALWVPVLGVPALGALSASLVTNLGSMSEHHLSFDSYIRVLRNSDSYEPLAFSAQMAFVVATVTAFVAVIAARMLSKSRKTVMTRGLDFVLLAAVALPGIVFAAGYIFTYNLPGVNRLGIHLYGTVALLGLAYIASSLPATTRLLFGSLSQLQESLSHAARAHGRGPIATWFTITVPMIARPAVSAWMLTFAHIMLELPISQLLYPPGHAPLVVGIEHALEQYDFSGGTAMQVLAILFCLAVVGLAQLTFRLAAPRGWLHIGRTS